MKFHDRVDAGKILADKLESKRRSAEAIIVMGIPRGGIILADIVAKRLSADFDIVIPRKLGAPGNEELAIGAETEDGTSYINEYVVNALRITRDYIEMEKVKQSEEIRRRLSLYRKPGQNYSTKISGKTAILVDDGVATGATIIASARWLRKQKPKDLTIAVPVAPRQTVEILEQESDFVEVLVTPPDFNAVGQFYESFEPVTDKEVIEIMRARGLL